MNFNIDYIFDFDCTITYRNFAYFWWKPDEIFRVIYKDIDPQIIDELSCKFNNNLMADQYDINLFNYIIFGSDKRIDDLDRLFAELSTRGNLIISSRGNSEKIYECLQLNKLGKYFPRENIYGTETNKTKLIKYRLAKKKYNVFYIDDNHEEHNQMQNINLLYTDKNFNRYNYKNGSTYIFCHSLQKESTGMDKELMKKIVELNI
jgi:hypothetical protein